MFPPLSYPALLTLLSLSKAMVNTEITTLHIPISVLSSIPLTVTVTPNIPLAIMVLYMMKTE